MDVGSHWRQTARQTARTITLMGRLYCRNGFAIRESRLTDANGTQKVIRRSRDESSKQIHLVVRGPWSILGKEFSGSKAQLWLHSVCFVLQQRRGSTFSFVPKTKRTSKIHKVYEALFEALLEVCCFLLPEQPGSKQREAKRSGNFQGQSKEKKGSWEREE